MTDSICADKLFSNKYGSEDDENDNDMEDCDYLHGRL